VIDPADRLLNADPMTHLAVKPYHAVAPSHAFTGKPSADELRSVNDGLDKEHTSETCAIAAQKFLIQEVTTVLDQQGGVVLLTWKCCAISCALLL